MAWRTERNGAAAIWPAIFEHLVHQLVVRIDALHQADALGLGGVDDLAGEDHLHGAADADELRQVARAAGLRHEARRHRDLAEPRLVGGVADVAGGREFEPDADRGAVDGGDGHRLQLLELADGALDHDVAQVVEEVIGQLLVGAEVAEIVLVVERAERGRFAAQIAAGGKAAALAGDDDDAQACRRGGSGRG